MYNSTPHATTGKTPSELIFRKQFRDKIPSLEIQTQSPIDDAVKEKDKIEKEKGKQYSEEKECKRKRYTDR
nr:unnamed protein product [Callosobruchus chinensis]